MFIVVVDTIFYPPSIRVPNLEKSKKFIFSPWGRKNIQNDVATCLDTKAPKLPFSTKMTKMPLVNLGLTEGRVRSKSSHKNIFRSFIPNPSFSEIFGKFDLVNSELTLDGS